jgi:hypothetical protein
VTTPAWVTVAIAGLALDQLTLGPVTLFPVVSTTLTASVTVAFATTPTVEGVIVTVGFLDAGSSETSTTAWALCVPAMAMMLAVPGLCADTTPLVETVATLESEETQTMG